MSKKKPIKGVSCITRKGVDYWYARINGERQYCGKGDKGRKLAETARMKYQVKQFENREVNAGMKVKRVEFKTVQDVSNYYMTLPSVQEYKNYKRDLIAVRHLLKHFGKKPVNGVSSDEQERYREYRKGQGAADATVNFEISKLSAMYHVALKRKKIHADMMPGEFVRKGISIPRPIVPDSDFESLLEHVDTDFQDLMLCAYETAMRVSEIINLTPGQVHLDIQHISGAIVDYIDLGIFDTKTGARRTVPISPRLKEVIQRRMVGLDVEDCIFTNEGRKYYVVIIADKLKAACKKADIPYGDKTFNKKGERIGIVFHCFRNSRTSKWVDMGFSDEIIRRATGHQSLAAYQKYVKLDPAAVMRLVNDENSKRYKNGIKSARSL